MASPPAASFVSESAQKAFQHAPTVNAMIKAFEDGSYASGIQAFGAEMRALLVQMGLAEEGKPIHYNEVAPHEDNRDGELLIPIGVWNLLSMLVEKGWNELETKLALTCGIPPNTDGERWKAKAVALAEASDGMLCPYKPEVLTAVSAAGSHTTAALRFSPGAHMRVLSAQLQSSITCARMASCPILKCSRSSRA